MGERSDGLCSVSPLGDDSVGLAADGVAAVHCTHAWLELGRAVNAILPVLPAEVLNLFIVLVAAELGAAAAAQNANKIELYRNESDVRYKV